MEEPDIDYFKDLGAHTLLEVIPNSITHGLTDPKKVNVLRWIAGRDFEGMAHPMRVLGEPTPEYDSTKQTLSWNQI